MPRSFVFPEARERQGPGVSIASEVPFHGWDDQEYGGGGGTTGAAGEVAQIQLFNPENALRRLRVRRITVTTTTAQLIVVNRTTTPLTTLQAVWAVIGGRGYAGSGQIRLRSSATAPGVAAVAYDVLASVPYDIDFIGGRLDPGEGLVVWGATVATLVRVTFLGREEDFL